MTNLTPFGLCVRKLRLEHGLKLKHMAETLDVSESYASGMETGSKSLSEGYVLRVMDYFATVGYARTTQEEENVRSKLRDAADRVITRVDLSDLRDDQRLMVKSLIRILKRDGQASRELMELLELA